MKTGYTKAENAAQAARIKAQAAAMVAELPQRPLQALELVCGCSMCIDAEAYGQLIRTPPPHMTTAMIRQYFGGAGVLEVETDASAQLEARVIFTHVLAHLGAAVCRPRTQERVHRREESFIEPNYWILPLLRTGFLDTLPHEVAAQYRVFLIDVVTHAVATGSARLGDALTYLAMVTNALPDVLEKFRIGPPRRYLRFWTTLAVGSVSSHPEMTRQARWDIHLSCNAMPIAARLRLLDALASDEVEALITRYALAARDEGWMLYLSRLLEWRDRSVLATRFSDYRDEVLE
ncbi:MAG: hypothetical protein Gyms2KO_37040 [Gymnodinialimonas sp.]